VFHSSFELRQTDARTAELTKYMENAFLATKVAFCNQFYDLAGAMGVDYNELRELWLMDPRIGRSHTWVYPDDRGFGGKCLPKDLAAIIAASEAYGADTELLKAVQRANAIWRSVNCATDGYGTGGGV
jgi:UDP-glucose 6-dehydrogenase